MTGEPTLWNPRSPRDWAQALFLAEAPLFSAQDSARHLGTHSVLLDGDRSSFAMSVVDADTLGLAADCLSWSWSSRLRHHLVYSLANDLLMLMRWDRPDTVRRFRVPQDAAAAKGLLARLSEAEPGRASDVVDFVLRGFRRLRGAVTDGLQATHLLNALLAGTEAVMLGRIEARQWIALASTDELGEALRSTGDDLCGRAADGLRTHLPLADLPLYFAKAHEITGLTLDPGLLLRHAAGALYAEAHIEIARLQLTLPGMGPEVAPRGARPHDVHFTPPSLARALVEQAFAALPEDWTREPVLDILDPACGSGAFLMEAARELLRRGHDKRVRLRGLDRSRVAAAVTEFCLRHELAGEPAAREWEIDIRAEDALAVEAEWGYPNVILMNPPFARWREMPGQERQTVKAIVGNSGPREPDKALAFLLRALRAAQPGGVLSSVTPAWMMDYPARGTWRQLVLDQAHLRVAGRLQGFGMVFAGAMVEPGFVVLTKDPLDAGAPPEVRMVYAPPTPDAADEALRLMRSGDIHAEGATGAECYTVSASVVDDGDWLPRPERQMRVVQWARRTGLPTAVDTFRLTQGVSTGWNEAFLLDAASYRSLKPTERRYFRPAATTAAFVDGRLRPVKYVFYPYDASGPLLPDEDALRAAVPGYVANALLPHRARLARRPAAADGRWWLLSRPRRWSVVTAPKLLSAQFGLAGSLAFDDEGGVVPIDGYVWEWRRGAAASLSDFAEGDLSLAYLAILNSGVFESILRAFSPLLAGGQLTIQPRYVHDVPLPDLSEERIPSELAHSLAAAGWAIHREGLGAVSGLDVLVAAAYGVTVDWLVGS